MSILYIIGTPIGNLEDISLRALRILKEVDLIACEDTRQTAKLLRNYDIHTDCTAYHSHNQSKAAFSLVKLLEKGKKIALVTDGGTPGISDPGALLVRLARQKEHDVLPVPGASALSAMLSVAGVPTGGVVFEGFLSPRPGKRKKRINELLPAKGGFVLFESPYKIVKLLELLNDIAPERTLLIGREITKLHEEIIEGIPKDLLTDLTGRAKIRGEFTIYILPEKCFKLINSGDDI